MLTLIISDNQSIGNTLRQLVTRWEHQCPLENLVHIDAASRSLAPHSTAVEVVIVALSPNPTRGLATVRQLRPLTTAPLIVVGPRDPGLILDAVHAGAEDYVDDAEGLERELAAALKRQSSQRNGFATQGRLIAVTAASGGSGRSLVAVNLAALLAKSFGRCCLMDLDPFGGVCASLLNLTPRHTVLDLGRQPEKLDRNTLEQSLVAHESGVSLLPGADEIVPGSLFGGDFVERLVRGARATFPAVVLDLHNLADEDLLKRLQPHNLSLIAVTRLDFNSVCYTGRVLKYWERFGIAPKSIHLAANRHGQSHEIPLSKVERALSLKIRHVLPDDPARANRSINNGIPLAIEEPGSPLGKALQTLSNEFSGAVGVATSELRSAPEVVTKTSLFSYLGLDSLLSRFA